MGQTRPAIAEFLRALDETRHLSPPRLQAYQRRLLARLLDRARRETAFYAERLDPVLRADGSFDWDRQVRGLHVAGGVTRGRKD